jgi:TldD protein
MTRVKTNRRMVLAFTVAAIFSASAFTATAQDKPAAAPAAAAAATKPAPKPSAAVLADPLLKAMREELDRSREHLKMDNVPAPYYIEYRLADVNQYDAEAVFGALRTDSHVHARSIRVVVRVGDYKQDSYYGPGVGVVDFAPLEDDEAALRRGLWLTTDRAYKIANEALASKKALLSQFTGEAQYEDFAKAEPFESLLPIVNLNAEPDTWKKAIVACTALYTTDPKLQSLSGTMRFRAVNQYLVNTEGTSTRQGYALYYIGLAGETQASDGMQLGRSPYFVAASTAELPAPASLLDKTKEMLKTLSALREAPTVEEDYRGPVLFSNDAGTDILQDMVGDNLLGIRPKPGDSARTAGEFSSNYKSRVLPNFMTVTDDPTLKSFGGVTLVGNYVFDDEGVRVAPVEVIKEGILANYLVGRMPIRDFPASNGHGRAAPGQPPSPEIGTLIFKSKNPVSAADLKAKLIAMCKDNGNPYGYYVETLSGVNPRLLYRVYVSDGHQELVRGGEFNELDTRTLRNNLVAAGDDLLVSNREGAVPTTVIAPSILFDELEVKRTDKKNAKLPEYPAPDISPAK